MSNESYHIVSLCVNSILLDDVMDVGLVQTAQGQCQTLFVYLLCTGLLKKSMYFTP
jgi:hypothetical protein